MTFAFAALEQQLSGLATDAAQLAQPYLAHIPKGLLRDYTCIAAVAFAFWAVEGVLLAVLVPTLTRILVQPPTKDADAKKQLRRAKGAAIQTVARLVGTIHNTVQVGAKQCCSKRSFGCPCVTKPLEALLRAFGDITTCVAQGGPPYPVRHSCGNDAHVALFRPKEVN